MLEGVPGDMVGRGDLKGGVDQERNAQISALKKLFYQTPHNASDEEAAKETTENRPLATLLGVMEDMPLCRWDQIVMLPGYNVRQKWKIMLAIAVCV
jgi:hypothetical protein